MSGFDDRVWTNPYNKSAKKRWIWTWYTRYGLSEMKPGSDGPEIFKQGFASGSTSGFKEESDVTWAQPGCGGDPDYNSDKYGFKHTADIAEGDSGGPSYVQDGSYINLIGHNIYGYGDLSSLYYAEDSSNKTGVVPAAFLCNTYDICPVTI